MGILRPIVQTFVGAMFNAGHDDALGCIIRSKLVGNHDAWRRTLPFQKLSHQTFCSLGIAAALHQDVNDEAFLIDGTPEPMLLSPNGDDHFVEVPFVPELADRPPTDMIGEVATEFFCPQPHGLVRNGNASRSNMSSTMRRLSGNRKYSHTACTITSEGKR